MPDPADTSFIIIFTIFTPLIIYTEAITLVMSIILLALSCNKPNYGPKRNANHPNDCFEMDEDTCSTFYIEQLSPFQYELKGKRKRSVCIYSCPFPDYIFDFRVAMCSLAIILCISNAFFKLPQKSPLVYKVWQFVIVFVAVAFFSLFILDSDATQKGYNFCMNNFKVKLPDGTNPQVVGTSDRKIIECKRDLFGVVCFLDLVMSGCLLGSVYLIQQYLAGTHVEASTSASTGV